MPGKRAASVWLGNNWDQKFCSERVAASSEPEGPEYDCPGVREPGRLARCCQCCQSPGQTSPRGSSAGPSVCCLCVSPAAGAPVRLSASLALLRPQDCGTSAWKNLPLTPSARVRGKPGLERECGWPLSGPDCPEPGPAAWKSPGLRRVGNGFLAPQPNCSTFWADSSRRSRSRPELGSFLGQGDIQGTRAGQSGAQLTGPAPLSPASVRAAGGQRESLRACLFSRSPGGFVFNIAHPSPASDPLGPWRFCFASLPSFLFLLVFSFLVSPFTLSYDKRALPPLPNRREPVHPRFDTLVSPRFESLTQWCFWFDPSVAWVSPHSGSGGWRVGVGEGPGRSG